MIRTFAFACALAFALVGIFGGVGYAQSARGLTSPNIRNPRAMGGQVNRDGSVARGSHFMIVHLDAGEYELDFDPAYFRSGCPILTIAPIDSSLTTYYVVQRTCRSYDVYFQNSERHFADTAFNLIAVASE